MSGIRTAVAVVTATVVCGGMLVGRAQQPARGAAAPAPAASGAAQKPTPARPAAPAPAAIPQAGQGQTPSQFPLSQTIRDRGTSVTGSFEGWYHGKDGSDYAFLGYFNRNTKQELEIPVGPNNRIDPGGPDQGQPTHFLNGRQRGVFALRLPKDLGAKKLVWTIVANGFTNAITIQTYPTYIVEPYMNSTTKAVPPVLKFDPNGPSLSGPPQGIAATYTATLPAPLTLTTYVTGDQGRGGGGGGARGRGAPALADAGAPPSAEPSPGAAAASAGGAAAATSDDAPATPQGRGGGRGGAAAGGAAAAARGGAGGAGGPGGAGGFGGRGGGGATWTKYRGPGTVTFAAVAKPAGEPAATDGKAQTTATFDAPGDYILRVQAGATNGEQCCWTNAHVEVTVQPAADSR